MRILLVEDEPDAARMLAKGLREQAFAVDVASDGETASHQAFVTDYDAIILDIMLPVQDGLTVCRQIRANGSSTPILMLTARDSVESRIEGLDHGADDYLTKPFAFGELLARLRAIIRRGSRPILPDVVRIGDLELETKSHSVTYAGRPVFLTGREYALLEYLTRRVGQVVGRADIAEHVWDETYDPFTNVIDVYIQRLRKKLGDRSAKPIIQTRRGEGYILVAPVEQKS
jgi:two-component system copper resistance phosphate regulon response regulator CusR